MLIVELNGLADGFNGGEHVTEAVDAHDADSAFPVLCAVTVSTPPGYSVFEYNVFTGTDQLVPFVNDVDPISTPSRYNLTVPVNDEMVPPTEETFSKNVVADKVGQTDVIPATVAEADEGLVHPELDTTA